MLILSPFATCHCHPLAIISRLATMLCHAQDDACLVCASRKEQFGKYLALKTLYSSESSPMKNLHPCLASIAKLKASKSLKPSLPLPLTSVSFPQLSQWIFFLSSAPLQKNYLLQHSRLYRDLKEF